MIWGHLENVLQEERIQFRDLPEYHKLYDSSESHRCRLGIQPTNGRPTLWCELQHGTLDFARRRRDVLNAGPFVFTHLQDLAYLETHPNAQAIADNHIEYECIPPALNEVGQQMRKGDLCDLPHHRNGPQNAHVPDENGLEGPAKKVTPGKDVQVALYTIPANVRAIDAVFLEDWKNLVMFYLVINFCSYLLHVYVKFL